jgi:predicted nucleic acid-binding protein
LPEVICDTSPIQYLHQLELLHILPALSDGVIIPPAVVDELTAGRTLGVNLPDLTRLAWVTMRRPASAAALPLITDSGPGETEVLMLALEPPAAVAVIDDALARQVAETLNLRLTGTLGLLIDAKRTGLISAIGPSLDQLHALRYRLAFHTRIAVLRRLVKNPRRMDSLAAH